MAGQTPRPDPRDGEQVGSADDRATSRDPGQAKGAGTDEQAASEARERYREVPMAPLEAPGSIVDMLLPTERLLAVRSHVMFDRRQSADDSVGRGLAGDLYLTSDRLILLGRRDLIFGLDEIGEIGLVGDRLLLSTRDGTGLSIDVDRPRLLRVEIGAARAAARR